MLLQSWEPPHNRLVYTILCFTIQYLAPSVTVVLVYTRWVAGRVPWSPGLHVRGVQGLPEAHQAEQPPPLLPPEVPPDGAEEEDQPDADHRHHHLLRVLGPAQPLQHSPRYLRAIRQHGAGRHVCDV